MKSDCEVCPNGYEYRFNPTEMRQSQHSTQAEREGCTMAVIRSSEDQAAAVEAMEPYIGWKYQSRDKFEGAYAFTDGDEAEYYRNSNGRFSFTFWDETDYLEVYYGVRHTGVDYTGEFYITLPLNSTASYSNFISSKPAPFKKSAELFRNGITEIHFSQFCNIKGLTNEHIMKTLLRCL